MNIANWLESRALQTPLAPALFVGSACHANYGAFAAQAAALANVFAEDYGARAGARIAIYMPNRVEYLVALYAAWWMGAVVVPVNHKLHAKEVSWILADAGATLLVTDSGKEFAAELLPEGCRELGIDSRAFDSVTKASEFQAPARVEPGTLAWLFYTSGTTGRPKGVMLTHGNLLSMSMCFLCDVDNVASEDSWLYAAPISHGAGLYNFPFVRVGGRHVVPASRGFDSREIFDLASELGGVSLFAAPTMVKRMVRSAPSVVAGLRTIVYGGGPMYTADLIESLDVLGPIFTQIYGQGESPMTITAMRKELIADRSGLNWMARIASVGTAQACVEVRVVDKDFHDLPCGESGEVLVRGPTVMAGYWRNEEASRRTLVNGWLCTGDVGFLDRDGFLTLTDRSKDLIISGGSNIYPREVEEVIVRHPDVSEVAVVGAPHPEWGEEVVAFVVARAGRSLDADALEQLCRKEIASFKKPKRYVFCDELPKNSYGKVLKTELRERAVSRAAGVQGFART